MLENLNKLIKGITSDHDLIELAEQIGVHLDGVFTISEVDNLPLGSYIILLQPSDGGTGHWVALHQHEYFDSMGLPPPHKLSAKSYNKIQYQGTYAEYCGIWSLLWLYAKQHNRMELFNSMTNLDYVNI